MSITDHKLTDSDIAAKGVVAAPTILNGTPEENKKVFDRLVREVLKGDFNSLIDALAATTGAGEIGAAVEGLTGATVQAVLNAVKVCLDSKVADADFTAALALKSDKSVTNNHIKAVELDGDTGVFTFTKENGTTITIDTALEKVAVNFAYDAESQSLVLTLTDGSTETVSLAAFITTTEFDDSATLEWSVSADGSKVSATIKSGCITDSMLDSALKAMLQGYVQAAATSATNAAASEAAALSYKNAAQTAAAAAERDAKTAADSKTAAAASAQTASAAAQTAKDDADRAESSNSHPPRINNGYWELWDVDQGKWVQTAYPAQGPAGADGASYTVLGLYATLAALEAAHPTGSKGDAWFVGTADSNTVYQWDVDKSQWTNVGALKGPAGADGITPNIGANGHWWIGTTDTGVNAKGEDGAPGAAGTPGTPGTPGKSAYESAQDGGYTGTETQFNTDLAGVGNKQAKITASGILKGDGEGGVTAAAEGTDYIARATFVVTFTLVSGSTSGNKYQSDKSTLQIWDAYTAGLQVVGVLKDTLMPLTYGWSSDRYGYLERFEWTEVSDGKQVYNQLYSEMAPGGSAMWTLSTTAAANKKTSYDLTLTAAGWDASTKQQTISGSGSYSWDADSNGTLSIAQSATDEQWEAWSAAAVRAVAQGANSLTLQAMGDVPTVDIPVEVIIL